MPWAIGSLASCLAFRQVLVYGLAVAPIRAWADSSADLGLSLSRVVLVPVWYGDPDHSGSRNPGEAVRHGFSLGFADIEPECGLGNRGRIRGHDAYLPRDAVEAVCG